MTPEQQINFLKRELNQVKLSLNTRIQTLAHELSRKCQQLDDQRELNQQLQEQIDHLNPNAGQKTASTQ